jgi:hypothetical protein
VSHDDDFNLLSTRFVKTIDQNFFLPLIANYSATRAFLFGKWDIEVNAAARAQAPPFHASNFRRNKRVLLCIFSAACFDFRISSFPGSFGVMVGLVHV